MRSMRRFVAPLLGFVITVISPAVLGQTAEGGPDWQTLRPANEEFSVAMPKDSSFEAGKMPYHKMELNTRLYLSTTQTGPVFAIVSLSGIKSNPALYTEMQRLNSYVDAFKQFLTTKVRGKDAVAKLTLAGNKTLNGHDGREYKLTIADLSGTAQVYSTRRRFYAVAFLNNKKADSLQSQFLESFALAESVPEPPPTVAIQPPKAEPDPAAEVAPANKTVSGQAQAQGQEATADTDADTKPGDASAAKPADAPNANTPPGQKRPLVGGVLNGRALSLPKPEYPSDAKAAKAAGSVSVQVTIDEYGNVLEARAVSGHPLLQQVSVNAALLARFSPTTLMGEPVKVTGVIIYNFVSQ